MKTKILLAMGLMASVYGYGQTYGVPVGGTNPAGTGGTDNVHLGNGAGAIASGSIHNVYVGFEAGKSNASGGENVFTGYMAGHACTSGQNTFIGYKSGLDIIGGDDNTFLGFNSGSTTSNGIIGNVFLGASTGENAQGDFNVFVGNSTGRNSTGAYNVCVGRSAGHVAGGKNVFIGFAAGAQTIGSGNVFIGNDAGKTLQTGDNLLYIANTGTTNPLIYGEFDPNTNSAVEGILKFNAQKVGIGFETSTMGFGNFPAMSGVANAANYRLFVRGGILAEEVRIRLQGQWPDYVFSPEYNLLSLKDTEKFIAENGYLPNMPSAAEVKEQGLEMGNIARLQQEKIEELTLHAIAQEKRIEALEKQVQLLLDKITN